MEEVKCRETARTSGDGMDSEEKNNQVDDVKDLKIVESFQEKLTYKLIKDKHCNSFRKIIPGLHYIYRPPELCSRSLPPTIPKGRLFLLKPKLIFPQSTYSKRKITRPPKFIPFEPYSAAVNFMVKPKNHICVKKNRNNLDINILVSQMSNMKTNELKTEKNKTDLKTQKTESDREFAKLEEERDYYKSQLNFQAQVNSELKNLLVAAVGEDLQTKVNVLTEDKLQLAQALLDSANNLSTHTEQIEFLANQCEVWRSKFLASSVMIEELARWKADLTYKNEKLINSNRSMLDLTVHIREMILELLKNLKFFDNLKNLNLRAADIHSLTTECLNISQQLVLHAGFGIPNNLVLNNLVTLTESEKLAMKALEDVDQPLLETDDAFKAIVGQAKRQPNIRQKM